jgi:hypothetical protein
MISIGQFFFCIQYVLEKQYLLFKDEVPRTDIIFFFQNGIEKIWDLIKIHDR